MNRERQLLICLLVLSAACSDDNGDPPGTGNRPDGGPPPAASSGDDATASDPSAPDPSAHCGRATIETDFERPPLTGPAVVDGALPPGEYLYSTTYLRMRAQPAAQMRFGELVGPLMADLQGRDGLLAVALGRSERCGTARTFSAWRDEAAMFAFVTGPAHAAAVAAVGEVSRGGSAVTHWLGDEQDANWDAAARYMADDDGPFY